MDADCARLWDHMSKCLDRGRMDNALCDTFVTEAIKLDDVFAPKAPKAVVFWSGAAAAAAKFAHAPGGRKVRIAASVSTPAGATMRSSSRA